MNVLSQLAVQYFENVPPDHWSISVNVELIHVTNSIKNKLAKVISNCESKV